MDQIKQDKWIGQVYNWLIIALMPITQQQLSLFHNNDNCCSVIDIWSKQQSGLISGAYINYSGNYQLIVCI